MTIILDMVDRLPQGAEGVLAVLALILALLQCFMGYRLLKLWVTLAGALVGLAAGLILGTGILQNPSVAMVLALVLMLLFGFLAFRVYKAGVFLLCGLAAYSLAMGILLTAFGPESAWWMEAAAAVIGVLIGILGVKFLRTAIILSTAIPNGLQGGARLMALVGVTGHTEILTAGVVLAALGTVVQFLTTGKDRS